MEILFHIESESKPACDGCPNPAVVGVNGEGGREVLHLCEACSARAADEESAYLGALDVEDRQGHFYISECTNYDGKGDWFQTFTSFRKATAFLRRIEALADRWSGLYPNKGVRETTAEELAEVTRRVAEARRREMLEELAELEEDEAEDDWPYDDDGLSDEQHKEDERLWAIYLAQSPVNNELE